MSTCATFPFDLLHAEIVKYAQERDGTREKARANFMEIAGKALDPLNVDSIGQLVHQAYGQCNAETKIEAMGFKIGFVLAEKVSKDTGRLSTELEVVKFICKEFWSAAFNKQVDNLRTNHQGVYVVQDNRMCVLTSFAEGSQYLEKAGIYLALPSGIIRGALANLGIQAVVTPTVESIPSVKFHIQIQQKM